LWLGLCAFTAIAVVAMPTTDAAGADIPTTGEARQELVAVDNAVVSMLQRYGIPGAAVGVAHQGRLVYARGYGYADREGGTLVQPDSRFRIASISKPMTAAAILTLVDRGKLTLDTKAFELLSDLKPVPGAAVDPRLGSITVRQLLEHRGGWDRGASFDPMFRTREAAAALDVQPPGSCTTILRWMLGFPLDFTPGTKTVYSNFGYCVLGRIIERVTGMPYPAYVRQAVLAPLAMAGTELGHTLQPLPGEVRYYDIPGASPATSVFDGVSTVPWPYGGFYLEAMDSHGGWASTTLDLLRLITGLNETRGKLLTGAYTWGYWYPVPPPWRSGSAATWAHEGALRGASSIVAVDGENSWALLMNAWPWDTDFVQRDPLFNDLRSAINSVTSWPSEDVFTSNLGRGYGHELSVTVSGPGSVTSVPSGVSCPSTCKRRLPATTTVDLSAHPGSARGKFAGWSRACSGSGGCRITLDADVSVTATFLSPSTHTLTVDTTGSGSGSGTVTSSPPGVDCGSTCAAAFDEGTVVTLTATPDARSEFTGWSNGCSGRGACIVMMDGDRSPVAAFVAQCVVPRVVRKKLAAARSALAEADCSVGHVRRVFSKRIARGRVASQRPAAGTRLEAGGAVDLVVSKGRRRR
jgi:N-acyl-D-amino-acid deacylase